MGDRLHSIRENRGWSIATLAARSGVSSGYISKIETGVRNNPGAKVMQKLAAALDAPLSALTGEAPADNSLMAILARHPAFHAWLASEATDEDIEFLEAYSRGKRRSASFMRQPIPDDPNGLSGIA